MPRFVLAAGLFIAGLISSGCTVAGHVSINPAASTQPHHHHTVDVIHHSAAYDNGRTWGTGNRSNYWSYNASTYTTRGYCSMQLNDSVKQSYALRWVQGCIDALDASGS